MKICGIHSLRWYSAAQEEKSTHMPGQTALASESGRKNSSIGGEFQPAKRPRFIRHHSRQNRPTYPRLSAFLRHTGCRKCCKRFPCSEPHKSATTTLG